MTGNQPLRVLFVQNYAAAQARNRIAGIFIDRQANSLRQAGVVVDVFDIGGSHSPPALFRSWRELRRKVREFKPDLVHAQYGTIVALISVLSRHPAVITFSGSDLLPGASISLLRTYAGITVSNVAALFASRVICVSEGLKSALWWRRRGVFVIPRGVDLDLFSPASRDDARRELGWDLLTPVAIIDGGRDSKNKGLDVAEAAAGIARNQIPEFELKIMGDVPGDRMPLWYRAADVLICASRQEGSPNVVKEALACNLPVIGVDVGDVRERLAGVRRSEVVARTPQAIAAAIVDLIREGGRSDGRQHVSSLSLEHVARRIIEVYGSFVAPGRFVAIGDTECS